MAGWAVTTEGRMRRLEHDNHVYELIQHHARGVGGLAWSAYRDGEAEPYMMWQARSLRELARRIRGQDLEGERVTTEGRR